MIAAAVLPVLVLLGPTRQEPFELFFEGPTRIVRVDQGVEVRYRIHMRQDGHVPIPLLSGAGMVLRCSGQDHGPVLPRRTGAGSLWLRAGVTVRGSVLLRVDQLLGRAGLSPREPGMVGLRLLWGRADTDLVVLPVTDEPSIDGFELVAQRGCGILTLGGLPLIMIPRRGGADPAPAGGGRLEFSFRL